MFSVSRIGAGLRLLAVFVALAGAPDSGLGQVCGNRSVEGDEQCDDGNMDGGDGCASNCTDEVRRPCYFGEATLIYRDTVPQVMPVRGVQVLTLGQLRASDLSGEIPFVVRADDLTFE